MHPMRNPSVLGMQCLRCQREYPFQDFFEGCPACQAEGWPASVKVRYWSLPKRLTIENIQEWLVYKSSPVLGEGRTPLVPLPTLAKELGVGGLFVKNEGANPTGSHKDRMSALLVRHAKQVGAKTIAVASSGNAGASVAAYAAHAGLDCVVVTMPDMSPNWRRACEMHGAKLVCTPTPEDRWTLVARKTRSGEWHPATNYITPAVGSNPIGVDGFRAVALELFLQLKESPATDIFVPTSRGDLLWGIAEGFSNLREAGLVATMPRVHAVEPFPRIATALGDKDYRRLQPGQSNMLSIGGSTVGFQALEALRMTGGAAVPVNDAQAERDQRILAQNGLYLELSSAAALSGARTLAHGSEDAGERVFVCLGTSHGYKEFQAFAEPIEMLDPLSSL